MAEICLSIANSSPCFVCHKEVSVTENICPYCGALVFQRYTAKDIYLMFYDGNIVDARGGGLVIGRDSSEDDIPLITPVSDGIFQFVGFMQGGEFIVHQQAMLKHKRRIEEINSHIGEDVTLLSTIPLGKNTHIFNTHNHDEITSLLVNSGSFIINRFATALFYDELMKINKSAIHKRQNT